LRSVKSKEIVDQLDLAALGYFVQIADAGGFSKASAVLSVPQPTLSRHIRRLEEQLGSRLFDRTGRGAILTEVGDHLYRHSVEILKRIQAARAEVSNIADNPGGLAVLGLAPIAGRVLNVPVARRFLKEVPHARLRIVEAFTGHVLEWIANGRIDVGILYEDTVTPSLDAERLWEEHFVVVSSRSGGLSDRKSISFKEVAQGPLVLPGKPHAMRLKIDEVSTRLGLTLNIALEIDGLHAILDLVHTGLGLTILTPPALYGYWNSNDMVMTPLDHPVVSSTVVAVCSKQRPVTNAVRTLLRIVREEGASIRKTGRADIRSAAAYDEALRRVPALAQ